MEENGQYKLGIEARLTKVETKLDEVLSNHLPHIQDSIDSLNTKLWVAGVALVTNLVTLILLLIRTFLKVA